MLIQEQVAEWFYNSEEEEKKEIIGIMEDMLRDFKENLEEGN